MINNRQNGRNNRRGRNGPRPMGGGGQGQRPDAGNRIDARQRGNAHQLHEKYKNLARDAQTQGDRVTAEYYLQFADHYFRVLNENRARQEEQRERQDEYRERQRQNDARYEERDEGDAGNDGNAGDDDPTAPISISGLPPAISVSRAPRPEAAVNDAQADLADEDERPSRVRPPRNDGGEVRRGRPPRQSRPAEAEAENAPEGDYGAQPESAERPIRRRSPRSAEAAAPQLELTPPSADDEAAPRRRTRRPRQAAGTAIAESDV